MTSCRKVLNVGLAWAVLLSVGVLGVRAPAGADAGHAEKLPAGPVRDRYVLMEEIGDHAKKIGDALKAGKPESIGPDAEAIHERAKRISALFEKRELHPDSRAMEDIWTNWQSFDRDTQSFVARSGKLVEAAGSGGDVGAAANDMFEACKTCHKAFRAPEKQ